ncbi:MAG: hypothetical protein Q8O13_05325 [Candidatus Omnitrophota bacterium]|nr:hypothetical protein [Candidatus Omnitrophota bacterium]
MTKRSPKKKSNKNVKSDSSRFLKSIFLLSPIWIFIIWLSISWYLFLNTNWPLVRESTSYEHKISLNDINNQIVKLGKSAHTLVFVEEKGPNIKLVVDPIITGISEPSSKSDVTIPTQSRYSVKYNTSNSAFKIKDIRQFSNSKATVVLKLNEKARIVLDNRIYKITLMMKIDEYYKLNIEEEEYRYLPIPFR